MKYLLFIIPLFFILASAAHPGTGLVADRRGNIYYTDLHQVWQINASGKRIVVPNVHTHELYMGENDTLFGTGSIYDNKTGRFYHYLWAFPPGGKADTVAGLREEFRTADFSLARDKKGNEYYLKRFFAPHTDTGHLYRKTRTGIESIFATGNFRHVNWLQPQPDGTLLYASENSIFRISRKGSIQHIKTLGDPVKDRSAMMIWGLWQDAAGQVYAALYNQKSIIRVDASGNTSVVGRSEGVWSPLQGLSDAENRLWIMEVSDKNEVQVRLVNEVPVKPEKKAIKYFLPLTVMFTLAMVLIATGQNARRKRRIKTIR